MEGERRVLQDRIEAAAVGRRRIDAQERVGREQDEEQNATAIEACTLSTLAFSVGGRLRPKAATAAPNSARISTHSTIEPSWFPHTPEMR